VAPEDEDKVTLAGTDFYTDGPAVGKPASEWTAGMKVGKATYDERLHAFWLVLDDFGGGVGHRKLDIREALGTIWDNEGGIDVTRAGRVVMPPASADADPTDPAKFEGRYRVPSKPWCQSDLGAQSGGSCYFGFGNTLYHFEVARGTPAVADTLSGTNPFMISSVFEWYDGSDFRLMYCGEASSADSKLRSSTAGVSGWGDASSKVIEDAFPWATYRTESLTSGVIIATTPVAKIIQSVDGVSWNDDDAADGVLLWQGPGGRVTFVGVAMAPWGSAGLYFHCLGVLYCLDPEARAAIPIEFGPGFRVLNAAIFQGAIYVTNSVEVLQYSPGATETIRPVGIRYKDGLPPCLRDGYIRYLFDGGDYLYGVWNDNTNWKCRLLRFTGTGWTPLGKEIDSAHGFFGFVDTMPHLGWPKTRHLWIPYGATNVSATFKARHYTLPLKGIHPIVGVDSFEDDESTSHFITGWIDGGFSELSGCLYRMEIDGYNLSGTEYIKVEFQLDNAESSGWTQLKNSAGAAMVFDALTDVGYFTATNPLRGLEFRTVRFRVTAVCSSTATTSAELSALILLYDKKPNARAVWSFRVDVSRMIELSRQEETPTYDQFSDVWDALETIWNTKTLVAASIPNVWSGNVKLQNMVATVDDYRGDVKGQGYIDVVFIEPI